MEAIQLAIKILAEKAMKEVKPLDAMQFAQAVLSLAHAASTLHNMKQAENL